MRHGAVEAGMLRFLDGVFLLDIACIIMLLRACQMRLGTPYKAGALLHNVLICKYVDILNAV